MNDRHARRTRLSRTRLEDLETSLDYLMSRFAVVPSVWIAQAVLAQLEILTGAPEEAGLTEQRRRTYRQLIPAWESIARRLGAFTPASL